MKFKNKEGFTLIELLTVIAVLGILVLLAAPKFIGYTEQARMAHIKNDIKAHESQASAKLTENPEEYLEWLVLDDTEVEGMNLSGKVYDKRGSVRSDLMGTNHVIRFKEVNTKLKGTFIWMAHYDEVVYYEDIVDGKIPTPSIPTDESKFEWVESSWNGYNAVGEPNKGFYKYVGTGEEVVVIPDVIKGTPMTSYFNMFYETGSYVKKVVSANPNVTDMNFMFSETKSKSLDLRELNTSNVTNMNNMFSLNEISKINIKGWNTSNVVNMQSMFTWSKIGEIVGIGDLNTSSVQNMMWMFSNSEILTLKDLSNWDTSNVTDMGSIFNYFVGGDLNLNGWDTSNVEKTLWMFNQSKFNSLDVGNMNFSKVENLNELFKYSVIGTLNVSGWETSNVKILNQTFYGMKVENLKGIKDLDTSSVTEFYGVFSYSKLNDLDLSSWKPSSADKIIYLFNGAEIPNVNLSGWKFGSDASISHSFDNAKINEVNLTGWEFSNNTKLNQIFAFSKVDAFVGISDWNTSNVVDMNGLFNNAQTKDIDLRKWDTSNVKDMSYMFYGLDSSLLNDSLLQFNTSNVESMYSMFGSSKGTLLDLRNFDTSNVVDTDRMFADSEVKEVYVRSQDDTNKLSNSSYNPEGLIFTIKQ